MTDPKTRPTNQSVKEFVNAIPDEQKRKDSFELITMMERITGEKAKMWGTSIIGFGSYHYTYASGREGDMCLVGFSPRKQHMVVYLMAGFSDKAKLLRKLGKHKTSKACLYFNRLADLDKDILEQLIKDSVEAVRRMHSAVKN